jgi:tetratricopeptide repeat protein
MSCCRSRSLRSRLSMIVWVGLALEGRSAVVAYADAPAGSSGKEAGKHFQRGVTLYTEADYRAALVEFRRAYEIAPNAAVLYNIGETYYQLQNYAAALSTLNRYLAESEATAPHRHEVEQTIETLQARVGKVAVSTNVPACEVAIDDEPAGKTPLAEPALVSIGHRKITVTCQGRPPETRFVDVAAGDTVPLSLSLSLGEPGDPARPVSSPGPDGAHADGTGLITAGWIATGVLGAGTVTAGVLAILASRDLKNARGTFGVSHADLASKSSRVTTLSAVADVLGAVTLVTGGVTLTLWWRRSDSHEVRVALAPNGIQFAGTFK